MSHIEDVIDRSLSRSPLLPLYHWRAARRLTVLAYHAIDDADRFASHLDEIRRRASAVTLEEALAGADGHPLPRSAVLITFDDGDRTVLDVAGPMLVERGMPAAVFAVAGVLGTDSPLWFDEARRLVRRGGSIGGTEDRSPDDVCRALKRMPDADRLTSLERLRGSANGAPIRTPQLAAADLRALESMGIAVGNHTMTHPCLSRCPAAKVTSEIVEAHDVLGAALGHPPTAFAYPDGDHDDRASGLLRDLGYRGAFLFDHRWVSPPVSDPFRISRTRVDARTTIERFRLLLSGVHPAMHHARGRT
jgi:peptidoglycan/xylan/chitin deacetylase (PgdA/CDA1 family)